MDYLIPKDLPYEFLKSLGISTVERVSIEPFSGSKKVECYNNVLKFLETNSGEIQFGWSFSQLGKIALKLTGHVVIKLPDGSFKCVTTSEHEVSEIYFYPDNSIIASVNESRLPAKVFALVDNETVSRFVKLENLQNKMRLEGNELAIKLIMHDKYLLSSKLIETFNAYND